MDTKFASNKSPLPPSSSLMPHFSLPLGLLSSFPVPHASIFFSHLRQPHPQLSISLKATGSSLLYSVCFLHPSLPFCSYLPPSLTHSALPEALCFLSPGVNEGVHVNLWWPRLRSFNQSCESYGPNRLEYRER